MLVVPFDIARHLFALPLDRIVRIEPMVALVPLPRPVAAVAGAVVHAGRTLAVYDLRGKFGLGARAPRTSDCLVLARARTRTVAIAAEGVAAVADVQIDPVAGALGDASLVGAGPMGGRILFIQDLDRFLDEQQALDLDAVLREMRP